ncbi:MAG TPA: hypothetical protein VK588_03080, partial [Chitinophagaceae bacterium]|nr:hypothetical protein [Chitinophagaceae bacterium]
LKDIINQKVKLFDKTSSDIGNRTMWEYFNEIDIKGGIVKPVVILDQFEEIFTIGRDKNQEAFITELADLAENRIPLVVQKEYENRAAMISSRFQDQHYRVIISLREDYLAQLESLKDYLPSIKESRFRVEQLTVQQAMNAILKPAGKLADKDVAEQIIRKLPGISQNAFNLQQKDTGNAVAILIEPFLLSLICYQVNEERIKEKMDKITPGLVSQFDISNVIRAFYNDTLKAFDGRIAQMIEETLLTESGYRKLQSLEELEKEYNVNETDIQKLVKKRIIRKELRDGVEYIELIHDVLVPLIKEKRNKRINEKTEQENEKAIKAGIELYRKTRNRNILTALYFIIPALALLAYSLFRKNQQIEAETIRHQNIVLSNKLIIAAAYSSNLDTSVLPAKISRAAYILNKLAQGENDVPFYNSMFESMGLLEGFHFESRPDSSQIRVISNSGDDTFYYGTDYGKLYKKSFADKEGTLVTDLKEKITGISISPDKKYLAVSGMFDYVWVAGISNQSPDTFKLKTTDSTKNPKSVLFTNDSTLIVRLNSGLVTWNIHSRRPMASSKYVQLQIANGHRLIKHDSLTENYFGTNMGKSSCLAAFNNKVAVGMDSGLIFIAKDTIFEFTDPDLQYSISLAFDPLRQYLFIGTRDGSLHRMSLSDFSFNSSQYQVSRISDIDFSTDGKYMVSACFDGSIAIWDAKADWNDAMPLRLVPIKEQLYYQGTNVIAFCASFNKTSKYVLAGYSNGKILKWPASADILADLICKKADTSFNAAFLSKYINREETIDEIMNYKCR